MRIVRDYCCGGQYGQTSSNRIHYRNKLLRTMILFACFVAFGISRSLQGPTLLELQKQVGVSIEAFQVVFLIGSITFPAGNLLAGFVMERLNASFFLSVSTLALAISFACIPFTADITALAAASGVAELALGLLDTGVNVYCLNLWELKSGPYFNSLHLAQSLGFLMSPILAESVITEVPSTSFRPGPNASLSPLLSELLLTSEIELPVAMPLLNPMEILYLSVGLTILFIAVCFLVAIPSDSGKKKGLYEFRHPSEALERQNKDSLALDQPRPPTGCWYYLVVALMTLYCACSHGLNFAYGHFLTAYTVKGPLGLSSAAGARLTSLYYASQVGARAANVALVLRLRRAHLTMLYLALVTGGATLLLMPHIGLSGVRLGSILVGLGGGSMFPMGLLWLQGEMEVSGRLTSIFCLGTTLGAQLFRFPEAAFIDTEPQVHVYLLFSAVITAIVAISSSALILNQSQQHSGFSQHAS